MQLLAPSEVAALIGVTVTALAQMRYERRGPDYIKISAQQVRYRASDVQEWIDSRVVHHEQDVRR